MSLNRIGVVNQIFSAPTENRKEDRHENYT